MIWTKKQMQWKQRSSRYSEDGYRTVDIMSEGMTQVGTTKMGDLIAERI